MDKTSEQIQISPWFGETDLLKRQMLGKIAEELAELAKVVNRAIIQGFDALEPGTTISNRKSFAQELSDVHAVTDWFSEHVELRSLDSGEENRYARKLKGFRIWQDLIVNHTEQNDALLAAAINLLYDDGAAEWNFKDSIANLKKVVDGILPPVPE